MSSSPVRMSTVPFVSVDDISSPHANTATFAFSARFTRPCGDRETEREIDTPSFRQYGSRLGLQSLWETKGPSFQSLTTVRPIPCLVSLEVLCHLLAYPQVPFIVSLYTVTGRRRPLRTGKYIRGSPRLPNHGCCTLSLERGLRIPGRATSPFQSCI